MPPSIPTEDEEVHFSEDDVKSDFGSVVEEEEEENLTKVWLEIGRELRYYSVHRTKKCDRYDDFMVQGITQANSVEQALTFAQHFDLESEVLNAAVINKKFALADYIMANTNLKLNASYIRCDEKDPEILGYLEQWKLRQV